MIFASLLTMLAFIIAVIAVIFGFSQSLIGYFLFQGQSSSHSPQVDAKFVTRSDGAKLHVFSAPSHPSNTDVLVFYLHGNAGSIENCWGDEMTKIQRHVERMCPGETVVVSTFDYRGFGHSSGSLSSRVKTAQQDADFVLASLQKSLNPNRTVLFGRSLGGALALRLAGSSHLPLFLETPLLGTHCVKMLAFLNSVLPDILDSTVLLQERRAQTAVVLGQEDTILCAKATENKLPMNIFRSTVKHRGHNNVTGTCEWIQALKSVVNVT